MTLELTSLLEELEIKAVPLYAYRGPGATMAIACMESILKQYGYAHLKFVLMSIAETRNNKRELVAPVIWAVSDLIRAHPEWADRASEWFDAFDRVDLAKIRTIAKRNRNAVKPRAAIATLLFGFLCSRLDQQQETGPLKKPARRMAAAKSLGWKTVPIRIIDIDAVVLGEHAENELRKDFTVSERVAIGEEVEKKLGERKGERNDLAEFSAKSGKTADIAGEKAGFGSGDTYLFKQAGSEEMPADIRQGTRRDAILFSVGANESHGLRRTNEDKRRAIFTLLQDEEWAAKGFRWIAEKCAVSDFMVRQHASAIKSQIERPDEKTVTRAGTTYTQNTANIGKPPVVRVRWDGRRSFPLRLPCG